MASLNREVTVLVLPPNELSTWRLKLNVRVLLGAAAAWTLLTLWAGYQFARSADYWAMKADNAVMRMKMSALNEEIGKSKESIDRAQEADAKLRALLALPTKRAIVESASEIESKAEVAQAGKGGPAVADQLALFQRLRDSSAVDPEDLRRLVMELRQRSEKTVAKYKDLSQQMAAQRLRLRATPIGWPADGRLTSKYGYRFSPMGGDEDADEFHPGLDVANKKGTTITATADGVVRQAGWTRGYGNMILIDHGQGYATLYGHASQLLAKNGQRVHRGDPVALMGSTGRSTGSHVHYEVWFKGRTVNPARFLREP